MLKRLFALFLVAQAAQAAMPESFKVLGRGIHDRENDLVLQLACTGGWDENNPETWLSEPTCDEARFVLFTGAGDPHWVGNPIHAKDAAEVMKVLKLELSGAKDYSARVLHDIRPNQVWQKNRTLKAGQIDGRLGAVGGLFMLAATGGLVLLNAPQIVAFVGGPLVGWKIYHLLIDSGFGSAYALKKMTNGSSYSDVAHTISLRELQNRNPENWSVRPVALKSEGFRLVLNTVTGDDSVLADSLPAKACRYSSVNVTYEGTQDELGFFLDMGAWPNARSLMSGKNGVYEWSFYDRAKNAPGCDPDIPERKTCLHHITFQSKTFFDQTLRSSWLKVPTAPVANLNISRVNPRKLKATLSLEGEAQGPVISATGHDPIKLMRALFSKMDDDCRLLP